jgi:hypothetical protein
MIQCYEINCRFYLNPVNSYVCGFEGISLPAEAENATITIGGEHLSGKTNHDVNVMIFLDSEVPFIVTQVFEDFPNLNSLELSNSGLIQIQTNAFRNVPYNLRFLTIDRCNLPTIPANSFLGLSTLRFLSIVRSGVETIHPNAFTGLNMVDTLSLRDNRIQELPPRVFRNLRRLRFLFLFGNQLERLDGQLLTQNPHLVWLFLSDNNIKAIQRNFFDQNRDIAVMNILRNECADFNMNANRTRINNELETCFENFEANL